MGPADDPVVGRHYGIGEEHLPLDGADRKNREATVLRELAQPVGEVAFPLPAQPRDPRSSWRPMKSTAAGGMNSPGASRRPG